MQIVELYQAVQDKVKEEQNGSLSIAAFNIKNKSAGIWLLDYLTGDVEGLKPPEPYNNKKLSDWLSTFLFTTKGIVDDGLFAKPSDYYMWDDLAIISSWKDEECGDEIIREGCDTPIEVLDVNVFTERCKTHIKSLKPSIKKPIAKIVGNNFEFNPKDLGSISLTYKRYPVFGEVKVKIDPIYNDEVPDEVNSINSDWPEYARNLLVWYIARSYSVGTRENALTQQLQVEQKSERG